MPSHAIDASEYARIAKIDSMDERTVKFLNDVVSTWDNIIEYIYQNEKNKIEQLYDNFKSYKRSILRKNIVLTTSANILMQDVYYTKKEQYLFIASASDAYMGKGIAYLQLLRQIKAQLVDGIGINSLLSG